MKIISRAIKCIFVCRLFILLFIMFLSAMLQIGCNTYELKSNWRDREITVDGKSDDWVGAMMYIEDKNISVGILNDESCIYVCMIAQDPLVLTQVMRQGFTLWFDPDGGKDKNFGIKFPVGMQESNIPRMMRDSEPGPERLREASEGSLDELEILGPGEDMRNRMPVEEVKGIDINVKVSSGMLVYELKVPLLPSEQYPHVVGAKAGSLIGIGLETPKMDMDAIRESVGGRMPGAGGGGRGGMGGISGGRGMPGSGMPRLPKPLKVWVTVELASIKSPVS